MAGEKQFEIVVVRSQNSVKFCGAATPVNLVFALAGSKDEQTPDFLANWMKVKSEDDLRNLILLAERARKGDI
ncbi:MAG: PTS sugar transporter subunit IIA [Spirochaetales bacterium]|nr:PTS sugar transporter subunit IIA [Spirochaetales bacterium]